MKKFWITSVVIILISAILFSISLFYFIGVTKENEATVDQIAPTTVKTDNKNEKPTEATTKCPAEFMDGGIFSANYDKAYEYMMGMTTEQMVGQLIVGSCPVDETAETMMTRYALSGYYYEDDNFYYMSADEIKSAIEKYQSNASTPMIMAVEEEGGAATALSDLEAFPEYEFSSPRDVYAEGGLDAVKDNEASKAMMLKSVGLNMNLSPVLDMAEDYTQIMYSRSLGGTVDETSKYASEVTTLSQSKGVSVALKHFPGYGTIPDSYEPVVVDDREESVFVSTDYKPFEAGINAGAHCVLVSNVLHTALDDKCVASLSADIHKTLRDDLKFTGLIMTDNLNNADYSYYADNKSVYVQAVVAGNDLIMVDNIEDAYTDILDAVNDGTIDKTTLHRACLRVLAYKYTTGIMK